jgi:hypothetical protein
MLQMPKLFRFRVTTSVVVGRLRWGSFWSGVASCHTTVNHKISTVDEAALVLAAVALGLVVTEPVLKKGSTVAVSIL